MSCGQSKLYMRMVGWFTNYGGELPLDLNVIQYLTTYNKDNNNNNRTSVSKHVFRTYNTCL